MDGLQTCGDDNACKMFVESVRGKKFLFALTISHTETCTIPGITIAGATPELAKYTPAADVPELSPNPLGPFMHYWICTLLITADCRDFHRAIIVPRIHDQLII